MAAIAMRAGTVPARQGGQAQRPRSQPPLVVKMENRLANKNLLFVFASRALSVQFSPQPSSARRAQPASTRTYRLLVINIYYSIQTWSRSRCMHSHAARPFVENQDGVIISYHNPVTPLVPLKLYPFLRG